MNTNDILSKVTLNFAGGGKLNLSDYAPYISNGEVAVEGVIEATDEPVHKESIFDKLFFTDKEMFVEIIDNNTGDVSDMVPFEEFIDNINDYDNNIYDIYYKYIDFEENIDGDYISLDKSVIICINLYIHNIIGLESVNLNRGIEYDEINFDANDETIHLINIHNIPEA